MTRIAILAGAMLAAGSIAGCAVLDRARAPEPAEIAQAAPVPVQDMPGQVEAVHAAAIAQDQAVFWVASNGCTSKADLTPVVRKDEDGAVLTLRRIKDDRCTQTLPEGIELRWTFQELGLEPGARVSVENPYQLPRG